MSTTTKRNSHKLGTGHTISLTAQEERMLRRVYDYMQGFGRRSHLQQRIDTAKAEYNRLFSLVPVHVRNIKGDTVSFKNFYAGDEPTESEKNTEAFIRTKEQIKDLEELQKRMEASDFCISSSDLDLILKKLGFPRSAKELEFLIWEVDENNDGVIDWDEFQLTYFRWAELRLFALRLAYIYAYGIYLSFIAIVWVFIICFSLLSCVGRNIMDTTGSEPCSFFNILEFLTFDDSNKGYIIEDNCMEILFARYGSQKLENELQFLFGSQLR